MWGHIRKQKKPTTKSAVRIAANARDFRLFKSMICPTSIPRFRIHDHVCLQTL